MRHPKSYANKEERLDQLVRQQSILAMLPGKDNPITNLTILERLLIQGHDVSKKTVERDMAYLAEKYPHVRRKKSGRTDLWWAEKSLERFFLLPTDAMNLVMIMDHATKFGMAAQVEKLAELRNYAFSRLKGSSPAQDWSGKIISNTRFVVLEPSQVKPEVLEVVQQALLDGSAIKALYLKRGASAPSERLIKPLGLSYQDSNIYLACIIKRGNDKGETAVSALPLHRFLSAESTWEDLPAPANFDINSFETRRSLISQETEFPVQLKLRISPILYVRLSENALTKDQQLQPEKDAWWLMTGSLPLSQGLELWLLSQGEHLEVLEPVELREKMAATAMKMAALYKKD
jgi:predicted DNA-binding transcriptional regulator YafY